jgi:hypothetical protein
MRGKNRDAMSTVIAACAGLLIGSCATMLSDTARGQTSYPRYGDSDDYLCNNGSPDDPRTAQACFRLRGPDAAAISNPTSRNGDSDDYLCNFAPPGDPRSLQACVRLRGAYALPRPPARYGDSDDFVCNHGLLGEPRTIQACLRLRGPEP